MTKLERDIKACNDHDIVVLAGQILAVATEFIDPETGRDVWLPVVRLVRGEIARRRLEKRLFELMFDVTIQGAEKFEATRPTQDGVMHA